MSTDRVKEYLECINSSGHAVSEVPYSALTKEEKRLVLILVLAHLLLTALKWTLIISVLTIAIMFVFMLI